MEDVNWIHVAQERDKWRGLMNTGINPEYHKEQEISWLREELVAS
jgi:hypothetical protein